MRWDGLFADLAAQAEAIETAERAGEVDERTRVVLGETGWGDRLRAAIGSRVRIRCLAGPDGLTVNATLTRTGPDWLLLTDDGDREIVVVAAAVVGVRGLGRYSAVPGTESAVTNRLGLRHVLRGIARDRSVVRIHLIDRSAVDATIDRVGSDFVEVALHAAGELRRRGEVREVELIPLAAVAAVQRGA